VNKRRNEMFKFIVGVAIGVWFADVIKKAVVWIYNWIKAKIEARKS